jgi:DNA-directed RNA polymerase subunit RPC12/RpoP
MRKEKCSYCGKEFGIRDLYKSLNSDDFTCKKCHKKMIEEGKVSEEDYVYADITEVSRRADQPDDEESYFEGDDWDQRDHQEPDYGDSS